MSQIPYSMGVLNSSRIVNVSFYNPGSKYNKEKHVKYG